MQDKKFKEEFIKEPEEVIELPKKSEPKKRKSTVANITSQWITLEVNGTGERIPYNPAEHATLKIGDTLYVT